MRRVSAPFDMAQGGGLSFLFSSSLEDLCFGLKRIIYMKIWKTTARLTAKSARLSHSLFITVGWFSGSAF
jgi:hypothetical protein